MEHIKFPEMCFPSKQEDNVGVLRRLCVNIFAVKKQ
jgi:hypothetical protein